MNDITTARAWYVLNNEIIHKIFEFSYQRAVSSSPLPESLPILLEASRMVTIIIVNESIIYLITSKGIRLWLL